ncbi:hypothetical protein CC78DRAFT_133504 [Lojkania enalia]|uniref:Uncharacterized protein n=1 Tax=Lojkania enalia TaxID=147567 RepID=A0A9P4NC05_9PLEO|nr:hypothetical protein CC78DRAFT_133504 [Didymosphaeria enalia]
MTLSAKYQAFLASPSSGALADNASLHYITTLTSIHEPAPILRHFSVQEKLLKKKAEKVLSAVESANGLCLDVETTIEFVAGGGAYLPGLDDNFVADRLVTFPMVHIVHFDKDQKIAQIRLYWDQGSLLKQIDVIGARARNWPIRDGKEQSRLIATSVGSTQPASGASSRRSTTSRGPDDVSIIERPTSSRSSVSNAMNDPHATLSLFEPRDINQEPEASHPIAPRAQSAKPPPRELSELFVGQDPGTPTPTSSSPQKERIPVKVGGGKNFRPNRLFEDTEEDKAVPTPISVRTNAKKYNHFEFGEGEDDATPKVRDTARPSSRSKKHMSSWDFEDFVTLEKTNPKVMGQNVRHFGWSDDEVGQCFQPEDEGSPVRRPVIHKPRPDADAHFDFIDDGTPAADRKPAPQKGHLHNKGLGLYQDHVFHTTSDDEGENSHSGDAKKPLGDVTTAVRNENRKKDFGSHWDMTDNSAGPQKTEFNGTENGNAKHVPEDRKKVLKGLDPHWGPYGESPEQSKKENMDAHRGIKTAGNGMGGRKGTISSWTLGGEDDEYTAPSKTNDTRATQSKGSFNWDF